MSDLKYIFSFSGKNKLYFKLAFLFVVVESFIEMVIPVIMAAIIDDGVMNKDIGLIINRGILMGICAVIAMITGLLYAFFIAKASNGLAFSLREAEYAKIQEYSFSNLDDFSTSSLITRMTSDINVIQNAITNGFRPVVRGPIMMIWGIILASWLSFKLSLVFFVCIPVLAILLYFISSKAAPMYNRLQTIIDKVNSFVQENLTAIRAIKAFVREDYRENLFNDINSEAARTSRKTFGVTVLNLPSFQLTMYASTVMIMWLGGSMIINDELKVGELTGVLSYVMQVMNSLMLISNAFLLMARSLASAKRVSEVMQENTELASPENPVKKIPDGSIEFKNVSFKYKKSAQEYALSNINLNIDAGSTIGLIGGTGSAKSSLVQLIPRLYDATEGAVFVGGTNVKDYDITALRDAVGIVLQKNVLFSGTIRDNLLWGNENASETELAEALKISCADEFVYSLPNGLDTELGQGGVNISGGQKQRLCIARTILKKPQILILDDSTSAVDMATDRKIRERLKRLPDMTKIIIAQRINSIMDSDKIIILEDGHINAAGTHEELLDKNEIYSELYYTQSAQAEE